MLLFRYIIEKSPAIKDQDFMEIILHNNAAIPDRTRAIVYNEASPLPELLRSIDLFNAQKVDMIAAACVTSYHYYDMMKLRANGLLLHPVKILVEHILRHYNRSGRVGILATTGTISSCLFQDALSAAGISYVLLPEALQEGAFMESVYMENGLKSSVICQQAKDHYLECLQYMRREADIVIGGCTETAIVAEEFKDICPILNVLEMMAEEAVRLGYQSAMTNDRYEYINQD